MGFHVRTYVRTSLGARSIPGKSIPEKKRKIRRRENFGKKNWGRRDRFRQKIVEIEAILAIFEAFEVRKFCMPLFGEFSRSSQDLGESDYDSIKSRDDRLNSSKSGMWIFVLSYDDMTIRCYDGMMIW